MRAPAALRDRVARALDTWAGRPPDGDAPILVRLLEDVGDALRLDLPLPPAIRAHLRTRSRDELTLALETLASSMGGQGLIWPTRALTGDEERLAACLQHRDGLESVITATLRTALEHGYAPAELSPWAGLLAFREGFDRALGELVDAPTAWRLLDERTQLVERAGWLARVYSTHSQGSVPDGEDAPVGVAGADVPVPPAAVLYELCVEGRHAGWLLSRAKRDEPLRETLVALIDALLDEHGVALVAHRWRLEQQAAAAISAAHVTIAGGKQVPRLALRPAVALAQTEPTVAIERSLGTLAPLDAEACVRLDGDTLSLEVFEGEVALEQVALGTERAARPTTPDAPWVVRARWTEAPLRLVVRTADGRAFDETIAFGDLPV